MKRAVLALLFAAATVPSRGDTLTQIEMRQLPADIVTERLMSQLADVLSATPYKTRFGHGGAEERAALAKIATSNEYVTDLSPGEARTKLPHALKISPFFPLATFDGEGDGQLAITVQFQAKARAAASRGVCTLDFVDLSLSPQGKRIDPSVPLSVSDFYVFHDFYYIGRPVGPVPPKLRRSERAAADKHCLALAEDSKLMPSFTAPDEDQALKGDWMRRTLLRDIKRGATNFDLDCSGYDQVDHTACIKGLQKMLPAASQIRGCEESTCSLSYLGDFEDVITVTTAAGRVRAVKVQTIKIVID